MKKCCPECGSENIRDTSPAMWIRTRKCIDCGAEWKMLPEMKPSDCL